MRRIRWAPAAAVDLEEIRNYLREHHPSLAQPTIRKLYDVARSLKRFPNRGRIGHKEGTRELIVAPTPYIIVYGVEPEMVHFSKSFTPPWSGGRNHSMLRPRFAPTLRIADN